MKKNIIPKKVVSWTEGTPKFSATFKNFRQSKTSLHGRLIGVPTYLYLQKQTQQVALKNADIIFLIFPKKDRNNMIKYTVNIHWTCNKCDAFFSGTALLRCNEGTFCVRKIYGDGNCMFRAISYILWRNEEEHHSLRTMVVQHIKDNWREYDSFVMAEWNISDRQEYFDYMSTVGTFASELECIVATKLHRMNLSIYREYTHRYDLKLIFHNCMSVNYDTARLLFTGSSEGGHYDVLLPDWYQTPMGMSQLNWCEAEKKHI